MVTTLRCPRSGSPLRVAVFALAALLLAGCGGPRLAGSVMPSVPLEQAKCRVAASQSSPLVTEWPASDKANFEAQLGTGAVAVAYSGCSMRVLPQCRLRGQYLWQRTTPSSDTLEIASQDELFAKLPLGAASLEGELARWGKLFVRTMVSGQLRLDGATATDVPLEGECARATHVVGALSVGAFSLSRGAGGKAKGGVEVVSYGAGGGKMERSASLMRAAGEMEACSGSTDEAPHPDCRSPIQVFLWPIPGRAADEGPPGTVKVDLISANASSRWDVYVDDQVVCTTPCTKWLDPHRPIFLRTRGGGLLTPSDKIELASLSRHADSGALQLRAHPTSQGQLATGFVFTSFGGLAVISGITLTGLGCATGRDGMCSGGVITLGAGTLLTAGSIWLIFDALPRAQVRPLDRDRSGFRVGLGGVSGRF